MKKSLVLAMAMALGVTASAYAANPFSDVPAGHWAYDSVNKLAAAGVIDGYGDATFGGDKLMTRYEMAQIVAKAMARGANVDKLAAEFADELDTLGVRVANLEKKADNVKITGEVRFRHFEYSGSKEKANGNNSTVARSRIYINGQINDTWSYTGMLENIEKFSHNSVGEEDTSFQRAFVNGRLGGVKVTAGRYAEFLEDGNIYDHRADGIVFSYGKDVNLTAGFGKAANKAESGTSAGTSAAGDMAYGVLSSKFGVIDAHVGYYKFDDVKKFGRDTSIGREGQDTEIWTVGAAVPIVKDLKLSAVYLKSDLDKDYTGKSIDDDGYVIGLNWKGAKAAKAGSYGVWARYYDQAAGTVIAHTMNGNADGNFGTNGFKGYGVGLDVTLAKNIVGSVEWYDLEDKDNSSNTDRTLYSTVVFKF
ncbi:MAG: S-layer homology domain-containing protein [Phascolarctobacterium sp.]|uniref:S-layer homology domain-containing protein n=1 Tax=Phascolarctobacterium sp. TaxID=2049039 RepID=UPI0026DB2FB4|nr:S-layer homology domain-containing protein [Phascolarctobacterium sp.]MDO4920535.1 S-layer homology domain-containing protein [Phascolarctobacterium sp.]